MRQIRAIGWGLESFSLVDLLPPFGTGTRQNDRHRSSRLEDWLAKCVSTIDARKEHLFSTWYPAIVQALQDFVANVRDQPLYRYEGGGGLAADRAISQPAHLGAFVSNNSLST